MAYRCKYPPLPDPPHLTRSQLVERLGQRLGGTDAEGHRFWHGAHSGDVAVLRVRAPDRSRSLPLRRMVWWMAHGVWVGGDEQVLVTCGQARCVALGHLRVAPRCGPDLTDAQVAKARRMYSEGLSDADHDGIRRTSPVAMTAWQLGLATDTVRRVLAGLPVGEHMWLTQEVDSDRVRQVHAGKVEVAKARLAQAEGRWTSNALADHFGVTRVKMAEALGELTSRRARVGPPVAARGPVPSWLAPPPPPPPPRPAPARRSTATGRDAKVPGCRRPPQLA